MTSSTILSGPCKLVFGGGTFYSQGDVTVKLIEERWMVKVDGFPDLQERTKNRRYEVSFTPSGEWRNLSVLWPYGATVIGAKVFSNASLAIWSKDATANKRVFSNAAITKLPTITASTAATVLGSMTITCLLKDGAVPGDSDAYVVQSDDTWPSETLDVSTMITPVFTRSWGASSPWDAFYVSPGGVVWDFPTSFKAHDVDGLGTVNMSLSGHGATAKFTPMGITEAQLRTAVGANTVLGAAPTTNNLICAGSGIHLTLYAAQLRDENLTFGGDKERLGEVTALANQTFTTGARNPLYRIATAAPA